MANKKNPLEKKFKHSSWFKEGVTVAYALDYFAKTSDFYIKQKPSKQQSSNLFDDINYNDVITDGHCIYRLTQEEKDYFLERKEHWKKQKDIKEQEWLNTEIDVEKKLSNYLGGNSNYDLAYAERELNYYKYIDKNNEVDSIKFWEYEVKRRDITKDIINNCIKQFKNIITTNKDFVDFEKYVINELSKVQFWNGARFLLITS